MVALLQGKPHGAIVHEGCRYLSDASRDLFVLELYFILKTYTKGRELIPNVDWAGLAKEGKDMMHVGLNHDGRFVSAKQSEFKINKN